MPPQGHSLNNVHEVWETVKKRGMYADLGGDGGVGGAQGAQDRTAVTDITAKSFYCIRLPEYESVFEKMWREDEDVKSKLGKWLRPSGRPAWMIIGLLIWTDAEILRKLERVTTASGDIRVPLQQTLAATISGLTLPIGNPGVEADMSNSILHELQATSEGSMIFGIQFASVRKPSYALFSNFMPTLSDEGPPRHEGGKTFGEHGASLTAGIQGSSARAALPELDPEGSDWTAGLKAIEVEDLDGLCLAIVDQSKVEGVPEDD